MYVPTIFAVFLQASLPFFFMNALSLAFRLRTQASVFQCGLQHAHVCMNNTLHQILDSVIKCNKYNQFSFQESCQRLFSSESSIWIWVWLSKNVIKLDLSDGSSCPTPGGSLRSCDRDSLSRSLSRWRSLNIVFELSAYCGNSNGSDSETVTVTTTMLCILSRTPGQDQLLKKWDHGGTGKPQHNLPWLWLMMISTPGPSEGSA